MQASFGFAHSYDITESRHGGNAESVSANPSDEAKANDQVRVLAFIAGQGTHGATAKEVARHLGKSLNCVSGRCSELRKLGQVFPNGWRRDGSAVLVAGI